MNKIFESAKEIEVTHSCDVLVAGGGIAGVSAAIAAARSGAHVILLEREYGLGGLATLGLITIYLPLDDGEGHQMCYGISEELLRLSLKYGAEKNYPKAWLEGGTHEERVENRFLTQYNPHFFNLELERLLTALKVTILYGSLAAAVCLSEEGDRIEAVLIESKSGRTAIRAKTVIDATGDADICSLSGAKTILHAAGNTLASWYYYHSENAVTLRMFGLVDVPEDGPSRSQSTRVNDAAELADDRRYTGVDGPLLSELVIRSHEKMLEDLLEHRETQKQLVPVTISSIPLVRMTRRLAGAYTMHDDETDAYIEDSIGLTGDWRKRGPRYELPFRCLYGEKIKNLLTAGRTISVTDAMWDITRVIPTCAVTGEAAGTAAAFCDDFSKIDICELQRRLRAGGAVIHLNELEL